MPSPRRAPAPARPDGRAAGTERLELALDAGELGTWDWDLKSGFIRWDERTASIFDVPLEEFDGTLEMFKTIVHPDDVEGVSAAIEQAIAVRGAFRRDYRVVGPTHGTVRWVSVRGRVVTDAEGGPEAMLGVVQDRSDAYTLAERLGRTLETIDEAFFSLDHDWRFSYVNARAEQLLQRPRDELLGHNVWELFPEAVETRFHQEYERVVATGQPVTFEEPYGPLGGWFEVRAYPDPNGVAVYFRDIRDRRERERREQRAHRAAQSLLDRSASLRGDLDPPAAAAAVCAVGVGVFACTRSSMWELDRDVARLTGQSGGRPLPLDTKIAVDDLVGLRAALGSGEPIFVRDARLVRSPAERELARRKGVRSLVQVPVQLGRHTDTLLVSLGWDHVIDPPDEAMLDVVHRYAQQSALAVEQARRRSAQRDAADLSAQLQASLLPDPAVTRPEISVGSLYRPGERRLMLGGDFYDCLELPDGSIATVIGDVTGHGPHAAAIGATLRAAWRALALQGVAPGPKVAALDNLLRIERDTDEQMVSVCCTVVSADLRDAVVASAGHPQPTLTGRDGTAFLDVPSGVLLGAPGPVTEPETAAIGLPDHWALLLYTDGLPEARAGGRPGQRLGLDAFAHHVSRSSPLGSQSPTAVLERLHRRVRAQASAPIEDDVALLLLRREPG